MNSTIDSILVDLMVRCMLNPDNKEFYIGRLHANQAEYLCKQVCQQDTQAIDIFWKAFHIAENIIRDEQRIFEECCK